MTARKPLGPALAAALAIATPAAPLADDAPPQRRALILVQPDLGPRDRVAAAPRVLADKLRYEHAGLLVDVMTASDERVFEAVRDRRIVALSYFGHGPDRRGASRDDPPAGGEIAALFDRTASRWRTDVRLTFQAALAAEVRDPDAAYCLASLRTANFGFETVRNYSCGSLAEASLAHQFVRPGGTYEGVFGNLVPCPSPFAVLGDIDFLLDAYEVPEGVADEIATRIPEQCRKVEDGFFAEPEVDGAPLADCLFASRTACGSAVADAFCQEMGYRRGHSFLYGSARRQTVHHGDGTPCTARTETGEVNCPSLVSLTCTGFRDGAPDPGVFSIGPGGDARPAGTATAINEMLR